MTITLEIKPEVRAELARQAAASGRPLEAHVATLLEEAAQLPTAGMDLESAQDDATFGRRLIEVCAMVRGLTDDVDFSRDRSEWRPLDLS